MKIIQINISKAGLPDFQSASEPMDIASLTLSSGNCGCKVRRGCVGMCVLESEVVRKEMSCLINICQKCESCSNLVSKPYPHLQFTNCLFHMDIGLTLQAFRLQVNRVTKGPSHRSTSPTHTPVISFYYLCWTPHLSVIINVCFLSLQSFPSTGSPSSKTLHC